MCFYLFPLLLLLAFIISAYQVVFYIHWLVDILQTRKNGRALGRSV